MVDRRDQGWVPVRGWPKPPTGWLPQKSRLGRRLRIALVVAACVVGVAFGGAIVYGAAQSHGCGFDPPPGDVGAISIVNDTANPVRIGSLRPADLVAPAQSVKQNFELCDGDTAQISDTRGAVLGCIAFPVGEPQIVHEVRISSVTSCK